MVIFKPVDNTEPQVKYVTPDELKNTVSKLDYSKEIQELKDSIDKLNNSKEVQELKDELKTLKRKMRLFADDKKEE